MKRKIIPLIAAFTLLSLPFFGQTTETEWTDEFVTIYKTADEAFFGRTTDRKENIVEDVFNFRQGRTLPVNGDSGYVTAVTVNQTLKTSLDRLLEKNNLITIRGRSLRLVTQEDRTFYVYQETERGIFIGFSLEKPSKELIRYINAVYEQEPAVAELVTNYYKDNYIIKIYQADNFYSRANPVTIADIMLNATLLGDQEQLLIGIHDGENFLGQLEAFYRQKIGYSILVDQYNDNLQP